MASAAIPNLSSDGYTRFDDDNINLNRDLASDTDGMLLIISNVSEVTLSIIWATKITNIIGCCLQICQLLSKEYLSFYLTKKGKG